MKLPLSIAKKLLSLLTKEEDSLPLSSCKHPTVNDMVDAGVLHKTTKGRTRSHLSLLHPEKLENYLSNHFGISSLSDYVGALEKSDLSRSDAIEVASNSKLKKGRTFEGFLVNCYDPIVCVLNGGKITIHPLQGTFTFIYAYKSFTPPSHITIVGVENADNFREIEQQRSLFKGITPLFVSRYPQNQSKDLLKWLQGIPNTYLHFGDFDFSGLNIYFNEYKKHLGGKAQFFIPPAIEALISSKGNRDLYNKQHLQFDEDKVDDVSITNLLKLIRKHKKGLEQEVLIH